MKTITFFCGTISTLESESIETHVHIDVFAKKEGMDIPTKPQSQKIYLLPAFSTTEFSAFALRAEAFPIVTVSQLLPVSGGTISSATTGTISSKADSGAF